MKLTEENKKCLVRAIEYYYLHHVWRTMADADNVTASDEDYRLREVMNNLGIRGYLSSDISARF